MDRPHIVIVGGGFSGAALAIQLARRSEQPLAITLLEPRPQPGHGVAYSAEDPAHRINVPAARMMLSAAEEGEFERWYRASPAFAGDPQARWRDGKLYPQRSAFGRYMAEKFWQAASDSPSTLRHLQDRAIGLDQGAIVTAAGQRLAADVVVLAISHPPPALPHQVAARLAHHPALVADPWQPAALHRVGRDERVGIIGTGLSMADVVASLHRIGHRGPITAFSRRGLLPRPNAEGDYTPWTLSTGEVTADRTRDWLARTRREIAAAAEQGISWQAVLDEVRRQGQQIWQRLPLAEQRRFLRHLRPWWDVHRYRIAPQVHAVIAAAQQSGQLRVVSARLAALDSTPHTVTLSLKHRRGMLEQVTVDRLMVTTGPAHSALIQSQPLLRALAAQGRIVADPLGLGILVNAHSEALDQQGQPDPRLLVAGPAARGRFGELMGLPQVAEHAEAVAQRILETLPVNDASRRCPVSR